MTVQDKEAETRYGVIPVEDGNPWPKALIEQLIKLPELPKLPKKKTAVDPNTVQKLVIIPLRP